MQPSTSSASSAVHPHARGEHRAVFFSASAMTGSSPRPWGTLLFQLGQPIRDRFIPTPVGNTEVQYPCQPKKPVHPHARGEHRNAGIQNVTHYGSSPRPWGTLCQRKLADGFMRFIPTPVGNTSSERLATLSRAVHPHARGEHSASGPGIYAPSGSSPRPWGTHSFLSP